MSDAIDVADPQTPNGETEGDGTKPLYDPKQQERYISQLREERDAARLEAATLAARADERSKIEAPPPEKAPDPFAFTDEEIVNMGIVDAEPLKKRLNAFKYDLESRLATLVSTSHDDVANRVKAIDPERRELAPIVKELKADPNLAELGEDILLKIARSRKPKDESDHSNGGGAFPTGGSKQVSREKKPTITKATHKSIWDNTLRLCRGDVEKAEKLFKKLQ